MSELESALEELYSTDPAEFTKKRDALAKKLKAAGDKDAAAAVTARRKPTQIAYVLNQLARKEPDAIADLVDVGRELAREQRRALRGEKSAGLRESIDRQRKTITALAQKTTALMKELGVDASHLDEVTSALQAALVDPVVGAQLEEGRLEKAPDAAVGFGGPMPEGEIAPRAKPKPANDQDRKRADAEAERAREKAKKEARAAHAKELAEAKAELRAAESAAKKARHAADEAERAAKAAVERARELAEEATKKESGVSTAEKAVTKLEANAPD